jgi:outer membrane receptor protein involved in Fe transport
MPSTITRTGTAGSCRLTLLAGAAAVAVTMPGVALAQDQGDEPDAGQGSNVIIVTASKREQTLQETPIAVPVTSGEVLEQAQIGDVLDLQTVTPSLRVSQLQSAWATTFIIRGFGNGDNNFGIEPSVGVFIDGVFRPRSTPTSSATEPSSTRCRRMSSTTAAARCRPTGPSASSW